MIRTATMMVLGAALLTVPSLANAQGASKFAPGQRMQNSTTSTGPGASEYAPGQRMQNSRTSTGPGASEYAPGQMKKKRTAKRR